MPAGDARCRAPRRRVGRNAPPSVIFSYSGSPVGMGGRQGAATVVISSDAYGVTGGAAGQVLSLTQRERRADVRHGWCWRIVVGGSRQRGLFVSSPPLFSPLSIMARTPRRSLPARRSSLAACFGIICNLLVVTKQRRKHVGIASFATPSVFGALLAGVDDIAGWAFLGARISLQNAMTGVTGRPPRLPP